MFDREVYEARRRELAVCDLIQGKEIAALIEECGGKIVGEVIGGHTRCFVVVDADDPMSGFLAIPTLIYVGG